MSNYIAQLSGSPYQYSRDKASGLIRTTDQGWDVEQTARARNDNSNCRITDGTNYVDLYIYELQTEFSLGNTTAQSQRTRTLFARNFIQTSYTLLGQSHNQEDYANIAEFVQHTQQDIVTSNIRNLTLALNPGGNTNTLGGMKGYHQPLMVTGYIRSFERSHERFVYAPQYQFDFVILMHLKGTVPYQPGDQGTGAEVQKIMQLKSWNEIVQAWAANNGSNFVAYDPYNDQDDSTEILGPELPELPPDQVSNLPGAH